MALKITVKATATMPVSVTCNGNVKEPNDVADPELDSGRNGPRNLNRSRLLLFAICYLLFFVGGCATFLQNENTLAVVNGEPITEEDLKYSLQIAHRREDLSSAGTLDLSQFVQKLINDRLIVQEAQDMGMEEYPEVQQAIQTYILRESVVRLHDDEILQKVTVTEKDIISHYKKNYERFFIGIIEVSSEEDAKKILEQLKKGGDFKELGGREVILRRNSLSPLLEETVSTLKPEELSEVIQAKDKYYIVKLIKKEESPDEELESVRESIKRAIRKQKEKERSDKYLKYLREKATIKIDRELLSSIRFDGGREELEKLSKDDKPLAEVNGSTLTVRDFVAMASSYKKKSKEEILDSWIDLKIVDNEALSRHYEMGSDLKNMLYRYKNQLLKNTFIKRIIIPQITISDEILEEYYLSNRKDFVRPASFKIQQITVKTIDEAQDILKNLQNGADFSWVAKRKSIDSAGQRGGDIGWLTKKEMPRPVIEVLDTLKIGDISPIININSRYIIIRLQGKREGEIEEFNKVKNAVYRAYFDEQLNTILNKNTARLKTDAEIKINDKAIRSLEKRLQ